VYKVRKIRSPNKIRDIDIAIAYHNTGRSMNDVGLEFGISSGRVEQIHHNHVRHVLICHDEYRCPTQTAHKNHSPKIAAYLQEYKDFLQGDSMKVEVIVDDFDGEVGLILSVHNADGHVSVKLAEGIDHAEVSIDDLKAALRTLSAK